MTSFEIQTNFGGDSHKYKKDTREVIEKLKQLGLYREDMELALIEASSNGESNISPKAHDPGDVKWEDSDYSKFFTFSLLDKEAIINFEYKVEKVNDSLCQLPSPLIIPEHCDAFDGSCGLVTEVGENLFRGDQRVTNVVMPHSIEVIGKNAFRDCTSIESVDIPSAKYIASSAFEGCCRIQNVFLGNVDIIGYNAFYNCTALQTIVIPKSVKRIGPYAFGNCTNLRSVVILNPEIIIEETAFDNCTNVYQRTFPLSIAFQANDLFIVSHLSDQITWVEQTIANDKERAVNIHFASVVNANYTNGKSGWTVSFVVENNGTSPVNINVSDVFLIREGKLQPCNSWLEGGQISSRELHPKEAVKLAAVFYSNQLLVQLSDKDFFENGALIGLKISVSNNLDGGLGLEERLDVYRTDGYGDYSKLQSLPNSNPSAVVFRNFGDAWRLVATKIPEPLSKSNIAEIEFANFVVRTNTFNCNLNHPVETIDAVISILAEDGSIFKASTMAGYCQHCDCYFLLETDFIALQRKGKLLCQLLSWEEYRTKGQSIFNGEDMKAESVLKRCGYTVNATDNLSAEQRQKILTLVLENGLYTATELCNFLDWLINYHGRSKTKNMRAAIGKWTEDRLFVLTHNWSDRRRIGINSIKYKK